MTFIGVQVIQIIKIMGIIIGVGRPKNNGALSVLGINSFSSSTEYSAGQYVQYKGLIYRFISSYV